MKLLPLILLTTLLLPLQLLSVKNKPSLPGCANKVFVDRDGDGINDLARDLDGDGLPDGLQSDSLKVRWAKFRAVPDSVSIDSSLFCEWWQVQQKSDPVQAWQNWKGWTDPGKGTCHCGCKRCRCSH